MIPLHYPRIMKGFFTKYPLVYFSFQTYNNFNIFTNHGGLFMIMNFMDNNGICTIITVDFQNETVQIENKTDFLLHRAFGIKENPTWTDFEEFLEERCFPSTRDKMKLVLKDMEIDHYDCLTIIRKTQGRMADDTQWIEFVEDET